jgi:exopolysaccharide production protein ExoZ
MLFNVQALRAVAVLLVVLVHLEVLSRIAGLPQGVTVFGNSGVDLFFVISGLIMVVTTAQRGQTSQEFLRNRITRIVPLSWLVTLGVTAIAIVAPALFQATAVAPPSL